MNEFVTWAALLAALSAVLGLLRFWQSYSDRLTKLEAQAASAERMATEAKKDASDAMLTVTAANAALALHKEQAAREARDYVTREVLREFEGRVSSAAHENAERISREISALSKRLDEVLLAIVPKGRAR